MDTDYLQSFVMAVDSGSMAEAARRLALSPATLKARVHALEQSVGTPLLQRVGRTVMPTQAGTRIVAQARGLLRDVRSLETMARSDSPIGELRLGVSVSALTGLVPPLLRKLYERHPNLSVYIEPGNSPTLYQRLTNNHLDASVLVEPEFALPKGCQWESMVDEPLCLLAPVALRGADPLELLATQPFLRYDRSMWGGRLADRYLREHRIQPKERIEIDALNALAAFVDQGLGVSLVPDWVPPWPEGLDIVRIDLPPPVPARRMGLLWTIGPKASLARELLQDAHAIWPDRRRPRPPEATGPPPGPA